MDRNYIIYNNHPFTLIWRLAFGKKGVPQIIRLRHSLSVIQRISSTFVFYGAFFFRPLLRHTILLFFHQKKLKLKKQQYLFHLPH